MPTSRNGSNNSHTTGYSTSAKRASGQQSTRRMSHRRNFTGYLIIAPARGRVSCPVALEARRE